MNPDVTRLIDFYKSPLGGISRRMVRTAVHELCGDISNKRILGLGFATPYMRFAVGKAERIISLMPARQGASVWPREGPTTSILCDPMEMPLPDASMDLVIAVHSFEFAADAEELMRELWRICAPDAHLVVVVPRRNGPWSVRDNTPFGQGNPFSLRQLDILLREHSFEPQAHRNVLHLLPSQRRWLLKFANVSEIAGRMIGPPMAGAVVVRARKKMFPAISRRKKASRYVRLPELKTQTVFEGPSSV